MIKKLMVTTLVTFGLFSCNPAYSADPKEMYVQLNEEAILVITDGECIKWKAENGVQLNFAYAMNIKTKETVTGCFTHEGDNIIVQLTDEDIQDHYEYRINANKFKVKASL